MNNEEVEDYVHEHAGIAQEIVSSHMYNMITAAEIAEANPAIFIPYLLFKVVEVSMANMGEEDLRELIEVSIKSALKEAA